MTMMMQYKDVLMNNNIIRNDDNDDYTNEKIVYNIMSTKRRHRFLIWRTPFEVEKKYEPIDAIGKGAYGVVCSCINTTTNEKVAIKKISNVLDNPVEALKVLRELKILRYARHENVIGLKDVMISSSKATFNDIYLVFELMDCDLHSIIKSPQPLSNLHIQYYMFQLLRGLNHVHSANIIHRDLKPQNLLVNENCGLKICDFGLSTTTESQTQPEYVVTRWYRAPEVLLGEPHGAPIDVWSVGCIFAELLGRRPIFAGRDSLNQLLLIICTLGTQPDSDLEFITGTRGLGLIKSLPYTPGINFMKLFPDADLFGLDLLQKMLVFDPNKRITVEEALKHPYMSYMSHLYDVELRQPGPFRCDLNVDPEIGVTKIRNMIWNEMLLYHPDTAAFRR